MPTHARRRITWPGTLSFPLRQRRKQAVMGLIWLLLLLPAGCAATTTTDDGEHVPPPAVLGARGWLAEQLAIAADTVALVSYEQVEWPDACFGLGGPAELCAAEVTPGWRAYFDAADRRYEVRFNESGTLFRSPQTAAADGAEPPAEMATEPLAALRDRTLWLAAAGDEAADMFLPDPPAWLRFSGTPDPNGAPGLRLEGFSGCNTLFGSYEVTGDDTLALDVGMTEQLCAPELMAFEEFMVATLRGNPVLEIVAENETTFLILQLPDRPESRLVLRTP